ncbi:hypothetical protein B0H10DRAFT_1987414 [Mycena sp. CBHHK59/15]|nr:hypothetical protein B0H10DRAFT_1987414 [Mycena sp. CBHHK59/15]
MASPKDTPETPEVSSAPDELAAIPDTSTVTAAAAASTTAAPAPAPAPDTPQTIPEPATAPAPAAAPRERELVADARLVTLRAMFPDFDDSLLQSVLASVGGDVDRAIDALLGMSDPDYTSEAPQAPQPVPQTQEELDEQLARTLMLEDEREQHAWQAQVQRPPPQRRASGSDGPPEKDTMQEFQEQFNKFAESGKKTFGTLLSKVKAKIQEFDQPAAGQSSSQAWGSGGDTYPYDADQNPYPVGRPPAQAPAQMQGMQTPQQQQQQAQTPAYYDPNPPAEGYDAAPASPPRTSTGAPPIDGGKLGMLPKRPVSLLRTSDGGAAKGAPTSSDDDELEYAENPFEEGRK